MDALTIAGVVVVAVVSITSHEAAHGFVADRFGDPTARSQGRLTLNPIPHIDPVFTILLPLFLIASGSGFIFGGAKPVPVDVSRLRRPRRDWALVGAAGPAMNLGIALLLTILLSIVLHLGIVDDNSRLTTILALGIFLNVLLAVFNLVPIPPLDGSRIVQYFLSGESLAFYRRIEQYGLFLIVAMIMFLPGFQILLGNAISAVVHLLTAPLGVWKDVEFVLRSVL